jgi:hydrogenase expression/formation protein HypE
MPSDQPELPLSSLSDLPASSALLPGGKLPATLLARLLTALPTQHPQLLLGPGIGEDAAVIDFASDRLLVVKSDPITFATDEIGYYAVNVCANDLAVTGATPRFYFPTVLLPEGASDARLAESIFAQLADGCRRLGIIVAGGHSEITAAVNQPVIAGTMLGEVERGRFVRSAGCLSGDLVLVAGVAPVEGVSIIAREKRAELLARGWSTERLDAAARYLYEPGISVLRPALTAAQHRLVTAMHDPTEGGVATGLLELAVASNLGIEIDLDAIPIDDLAIDLCAEYDLDPLGTIASGALLATTAPEDADPLLALWQEIGWPGRVIGRMLPASAGIHAVRGGEPVDFPRFAADEIVKLWR